MLARAGTIVVELSGSPQGKGRPRFVRATGHAFTPANTRKYESHLRLAAQDVMQGRAPLEGPIAIDVLAVFPVPASWSKAKRAAALLRLVHPTTKPDIDNTAKLVGDGFNEIVWRDDKQIVSATIVKQYGERPMLRVEIREIGTS